MWIFGLLVDISEVVWGCVGRASIDVHDLFIFSSEGTCVLVLLPRSECCLSAHRTFLLMWERSKRANRLILAWLTDKDRRGRE